jgi:hypothetical protein
MKKRVVIPLSLLLSLLIAMSSAMGETLFGPKQYVRTKGSADVYTDTFSATPGEATLSIENGDADGSHRVSSAEVTLNGVEIFGPEAFSEGTYILEAPITIVDDNLLTLQIKKGKEGSYLTIEVTRGEVTTTVTISANPETIEPGGSSTLSWTSANADSCVIEPDIGSVDVNGSTSVSPTETTTYTITASGPGGTAADSVTVTVSKHEAILFGPKKYMWTKGPADVYTDTFSASPGEATLTVENGDAHGSKRLDDALISLNGQQLFGPNDFSQDVYLLEASVTLTENNSITVELITGRRGCYLTITVKREVDPPTVTITADPETIQVGESSILTWSSTDADSCVIEPDIGPVDLNGTTTGSPSKTTTYTITATGPAGSATDQALVTVTQPEGSFAAQYEDLIPADSTAAYDPKRFSLITGLVQGMDGSPITDVSITIHNHLEYGTASTDSEGRFSIPMNGGDTMTVVYQKQGLLTAHRKVYVPWNDIAIAETVVMISEDPVSTTFTFDGNPDTVVTHQGTVVTDEFGSRSCTMMFTGDNRAYEVDGEGNVVGELSTITTRATEFTTLESMPAKLPPNSAYTYCAELSVDGAPRVRFDKPVITWVDNFLGFPVGEAVPVGSYDRDRGVWVPSDNGVVVKLLDTDLDGMVDALDADGDDQADDLDGDTLFADEVAGLDDELRYPPGSTFWRVAVAHFSPLDCNWPYGPPEDAKPPNPEGEPDADEQKEEDCKTTTGSLVEDRSGIMHEDIPVPGTDMTLHYASNRVVGRKFVITVPASGNTVPAIGIPI